MWKVKTKERSRFISIVLAFRKQKKKQNKNKLAVISVIRIKNRFLRVKLAGTIQFNAAFYPLKSISEWVH